MGTYASQEQVASEARVGAPGFTSATNPSADKVDEIIAEVEAEAECVVATRYVLPLRAPNALVIRAIVLAICASRVRKIIAGNVNDGIPGKSAQQIAEDGARARLQLILEGKLVLQGESPTVAGDGVKSYASQHSQRPIFRKECKQW